MCIDPTSAASVTRVLTYSANTSDCTSGAVKVGSGDRAQASRDEMGRIADVAATQRESKQRSCPERTFEAGLRWFCAEVKANVAQQMNGGGMMRDQDQLTLQRAAIVAIAPAARQ
eukprot:COSAG02_NODE_7826_length_2831_cov_7.994143_2_plen_115_part_00